MVGKTNFLYYVVEHEFKTCRKLLRKCQLSVKYKKVITRRSSKKVAFDFPGYLPYTSPIGV